jgi:hypothetical protein
VQFCICTCVGASSPEINGWTQQTNYVKAQLEAAHPDVTFTLETMKTMGDKILDVTLAKIGSFVLYFNSFIHSFYNYLIVFHVHSPPSSSFYLFVHFYFILFYLLVQATRACSRKSWSWACSTGTST